MLKIFYANAESRKVHGLLMANVEAKMYSNTTERTPVLLSTCISVIPARLLRLRFKLVLRRGPLPMRFHNILASHRSRIAELCVRGPGTGREEEPLEIEPNIIHCCVSIR